MLDAMLAIALLAADVPVDPRVLAPSLTPAALCEELKRTTKDRREERVKIAAEHEELTKQRAVLEVLGAEIEKSRKALRDETARLQALIEQESTVGAKAAKTMARRSK
jgi:hypothetical protein